MAQAGVQLSMPQMVDLALSSPEIGVVNFNILHSLLHVLIQQVDLIECKVELKGTAGERVQKLIDTGTTGPTLKMTEYVITPEKEQQQVVSRKTRFKKAGGNEEGAYEKTVQVIEKGKEPEWTDTLETVIVVETDKAPSDPHTSVPVSRPNMITLEKEMKQLKTEVDELKGLPSSLGLIDAIRAADTNATPLAEMFHYLTITKRVDAVEIGLQKIASLIEIMAREGLDNIGESFGDVVGGLGIGGEGVTGGLGGEVLGGGGLGGGVGGEGLSAAGTADERTTGEAVSAKGSPATSSGRKGGSGKMNDWMQSVETRLEALESSYPPEEREWDEAAMEGTDGAAERGEAVREKRGAGPEGSAAGTASSGGTAASAGTAAPAGAAGSAGKEGGMRKPSPNKSGKTSDTSKGAPLVGEKRIDDLEGKFREYTDYINSLDTTFNSQIDALQQHLTDLEKEIGEIVEKINAWAPAGDSATADVGVQELYNKMLAMQSELEKVSETASTLLNEKENKQSHMDTLLEEIELLKTIKANREDLLDALANKADTCTVNKKVSHSQFDATCDDLSRNIEQALQKLTDQEKLWSQALEDIQTEIENKLDKMELTPLRDFVHNKLKMLQDRLKALASLKQDTEAAGTKSKFLRNVNCLSCDKEVVMRKELDPSQMPQPPSLPPTKSIGPYLAYELDVLRKEQKAAAHGRNMNHFENALSLSKVDKNHICNRYCGGSHTMTTPQQRVARVGHFLQQWGPESNVVNETEIQGMDGHIYKARNAFESSNDQKSTIVDSSVHSKPSILVSSDIISTRDHGKKGTATAAPPSLKAN